MNLTLILIVGMICAAWILVEQSHDYVKHRELDIQHELARAIERYTRPSLELRPGDKAEGGSRKSEVGKDRL